MPKITNSPNKFTISVSLDREHYDKLIKFCETADISRSKWCRALIVKKLDEIKILGEE